MKKFTHFFVIRKDNSIDFYIIIYLLCRSTTVAYCGNLPPTDGHHHNCLCVTFVGSLDSSYSGSVRVVCHSHFLPQSIKYILIKNGCLRLCANLKMKFYNEKQKFAADHFMGSYKYNLSSICFKKAILHIFLSSYRTHCLHASQWVLSSCRFP